MVLETIVVVGFGVIIYAGFRRRVLLDRKARELLPNQKGIRRIPPFQNILPQSVPDNDSGRAFLEFHRRVSRQTIAMVIPAAGAIVGAILLIRLG